MGNEHGYDLKPVEKDSSLICSICLMLLKEAMGTPCSHAFCRVCVKKLIEREKSLNKNGNIKCPECRKNVNSSEIFPMTFVDRLVRSCNVNCSQKDEGCEWIGSLSSFMEDHRNTCIFKIVSCANVGCRHTGIKRKMEIHQTSCKHRIIQCQYCQTAMKVNDLTEHHSKCERFPTTCPEQKCNVIVPKIEIQSHLDHACKFVPVDCPFAQFGCTRKVIRKNLDQHCKSSTTSHMTFMCQQISQSKSQIQDLTSQLETANNQLKNANSQIPKLQSEVQLLKTVNGRLQTQVSRLVDVSLLKNDDRAGVSSFPAQQSFDLSSEEFCLSLLLLNGVGEWIGKKKKNPIDESYVKWYKNIFSKMVENKLYQVYDAMFIKLHNVSRKVICWSSNNKFEQDHVSLSRDIIYMDSNVVILHSGDQIIVETETLGHFNHGNSQVYALHTFNSTKLFPFLMKDGSTSFNSWRFAKLLDDFYCDNLIVLCLMKS